LLFAFSVRAGEAREVLVAPNALAGSVKSFAATGEVKEIRPEERTVVIRHETITNFMDAMTMPFRVKDPAELTGLRGGDRISFQLHVTSTESWIHHITKTGVTTPAESVSQADSRREPDAAPVRPRHPLLDYKFTNELGQAVSLGEFRGQALAITFFFTRCPIPEYCPRLSRNFEEVSRKLAAMPGAPTNWHLLSVSFDPEFDNPEVLKSYAEGYHYDPKHWSFLTGPTNKIAELAASSNLGYQREGSFFNHDFRTLIVDANGKLQMVFPTSGDLSDAIVREIVKAAAPTNVAAPHPQ
jgi:protein SCO1/2